MWLCFRPSVALSLALAPGDECEHLEYVFNDQVLGQGQSEASKLFIWAF